MNGFNKKKLPKFVSDFETEETAAQKTVKEIIEKDKTALSQISRDLIEKIAYFNHLKYPGNSELDNWYLALDEYNDR